MVALFQHTGLEVNSSDISRCRDATLRNILGQFDPIYLDELEEVKLLNRTDTKYVMGISHLIYALTRIKSDYRVLQVNNTRLNHYQTLYFDTPDFDLYEQHHNGRRSRYKVRIREYIDSDIVFWEVKHKTNRERTIKSRKKTQELHSEVKGHVDDFIQLHTPYDVSELVPKLRNHFTRITLVSKRRPERLTLDVNIRFTREGRVAWLPGLAIAEVKQKQFSQKSDFIQKMRMQGIRPTGFSKYCTGVYMLYDDVKTNNFKPTMRLVEKLIKKEFTHEYIY